MRLSDIQPQYFPRLHYFARMMESDLFVFRDDVQFVRNHKYPDGTRGVSYQAHTPIKSAQGTYLLTVPVTNGMASLNVTAVAYDQQWARKHLNVLRNSYTKSPTFARLFPELEHLLSKRFSSVATLNIATTCWALSHLLGMETVAPEECTLAHIDSLLKQRPAGKLKHVALGSELTNSDSGYTLTASERIVELCTLFGATTYIGGRTAVEAYLETGLFEQQGIEVSIQNWRCDPYPQQYSVQGGFTPDLSILDLLMNMSAAEALRHLTTSRVVDGALAN
jgi:hypothetical protein